MDWAQDRGPDRPFADITGGGEGQRKKQGPRGCRSRKDLALRIDARGGRANRVEPDCGGAPERLDTFCNRIAAELGDGLAATARQNGMDAAVHK